MPRKTLLTTVAALAFAALTLAAPVGALAGRSPAAHVAGTPSAPAHFFDKSYRLEVNLKDVQDLVFDATLNEVPASVPGNVGDYLSSQLESATFEVDATQARCFTIEGEHGQNVPCSQIADMVNNAADGAVDALILAKPVAGNSLAFVAKKITVWVDASGTDTTPPSQMPSSSDANTVPQPAKFLQKSYRLNVNLQDVQDLVFDASLSEIPGSVPARVRDYLHDQLDESTFEVDATKAKCFVVKGGQAQNVPCSQIADTVDGSPDGGIDVTILAKPVAGDPLSFLAKKITVSS